MDLIFGVFIGVVMTVLGHDLLFKRKTLIADDEPEENERSIR